MLPQNQYPIRATASNILGGLSYTKAVIIGTSKSADQSLNILAVQYHYNDANWEGKVTH